MTRSRRSGASPDPAVEAQLEAILQRLYSFYPSEIDLNLDRSYRFLSRLGNPHLRLPPTVHVAGTNGKGSTIAALRALLEASGHTVHVYTSPHLVHVTERVRVSGELISSEALIALLNECIEINQNEPITFFELFTCAVLLGFTRAPADFVLLEVGMGGRLDTTNVIQDPIATIITTISYDHMAYLGDTLPKIAAEKAGIMKAGAPCIVGYQIKEAVESGVPELLQKISQDLSPKAELVRYGAEWSSEFESGQMVFRFGGDSIALPLPSLVGNHQIWNAGAAIAAFRLIAPDHFKPEILSTAMGQIEWPGRLQTLEKHSFHDLVPEDWEIVIDGGHNDSCGMVLAMQMEKWKADDNRPLHLVVAMVDRKDPVAFLKPLLPYAASLTVTEIENERDSYKADILAGLVRPLGFPHMDTAPNARAGVERAVRLATDVHPGAAPARILLTGSLFFMGNILGLHN